MSVRDSKSSSETGSLRAGEAAPAPESAAAALLASALLCEKGTATGAAARPRYRSYFHKDNIELPIESAGLDRGTDEGATPWLKYDVPADAVKASPRWGGDGVDSSDGVMTSATRPKPVAARLEPSLPERFEGILDARLQRAVSNCRDAKGAQLAEGPKRRKTLSAASEFSACRCGSNTRNNRPRQGKPLDPGLLLPLNAWSRLKPDP